MSIISGVEVTEKGRWLHMAAVMAQRLQKIIQKRRVEQNDIPKGVWYAANDFFQMLDESSAAELLMDNSLEQNIYILSMATLKRDVLKTRKKDRTKLTERRQSFADFVGKLQEPHLLDQHELEIAQKVRHLFIKLYHAGEDEVYEQSVALEFSGCS